MYSVISYFWSRILEKYKNKFLYDRVSQGKCRTKSLSQIFKGY